MHGAHGGEQLGYGIGLNEITGGTRLAKRLDHVFLVVVLAQDEHLARGSVAADSMLALVLPSPASRRRAPRHAGAAASPSQPRPLPRYRNPWRAPCALLAQDTVVVGQQHADALA
jgi:hypothetical protein